MRSSIPALACAAVVISGLSACGSGSGEGAGSTGGPIATGTTARPAGGSAGAFAASGPRPASGGPAWAAMFLGEPRVPVGEPYIGHSYKQKQPPGWGHRDSGQDCYWIDESADKTATVLTKCNLKRPVDLKAVELWTKTLLPKDLKHDGEPAIFPVGAAGTKVRGGHATCTLKSGDADIYWVELATDQGRGLVISVVNKAASEQVKNEAAAWIQTLELVGKSELTK